MSLVLQPVICPWSVPTSPDPSTAIILHGNVERVALYNNVFLGLGIQGYTVYKRGNIWDSERTRRFVRARGTGEPTLTGSNNWICAKAFDPPASLVSTITGTNPKMVDPLTFDFRPRADSPLAGAGLLPLPSGRVADLQPEFEPQRGIPADLKPKRRPFAETPSIGPFEVGGARP